VQEAESSCLSGIRMIQVSGTVDVSAVCSMTWDIMS
jgi:hypothetical protein